MHCIMGKPTTHKPATSSMENSCMYIPRSSCVEGSAIPLRVCMIHVREIGVRAWFAKIYITQQIIEKSRQLEDYIGWLARQ